MILFVIFHKKKVHERAAGGHFSFEDQSTRSRLLGYGFGEYIHLRDEQGNVWKGSAQRLDDHSVRYTFRDEGGHVITGVSDHYGITLRDGKGIVWRGYVD